MWRYFTHDKKLYSTKMISSYLFIISGKKNAPSIENDEIIKCVIDKNRMIIEAYSDITDSCHTISVGATYVVLKSEATV